MVIAQLVLACAVIITAIIVGTWLRLVAFCAREGRRMPMPQRQAVPARVVPPPQRVAVTLWEPRPIKGELDR